MTLSKAFCRTLAPCLVALFQGLTPVSGYAVNMPEPDVLMPSPIVSVAKDPDMKLAALERRRYLEVARTDALISTYTQINVQAEIPKFAL